MEPTAREPLKTMKNPRITIRNGLFPNVAFVATHRFSFSVAWLCSIFSLQKIAGRKPQTMMTNDMTIVTTIEPCWILSNKFLLTDIL